MGALSVRKENRKHQLNIKQKDLLLIFLLLLVYYGDWIFTSLKTLQNYVIFHLLPLRLELKEWNCCIKESRTFSENTGGPASCSHRWNKRFTSNLKNLLNKTNSKNWGCQQVGIQNNFSWYVGIPIF